MHDKMWTCCRSPSRLPGAGWLPFDPTNGPVSDHNLIRVAVTRDPSQAVPLSGTFLGRPEDFLRMTDEVEIKSEPDG